MTSIIVITGVNGGLGQALARAAADGDLTVEGIGRSAPDPALPDTLTFTRMDCTDEELVPAFWRDLRERHGARAEVILVNNAGKYYRAKVKETDLGTAARIMTDNYLAAVNMTFGFLEQYSAGRIVNLNSFASVNPRPGLGVYSAAKGAQGNFFSVLRQELRGTGFRIMNLYPYRINTWSEEREAGTIDRDEIAGWIVAMARLAGTFEVAECTLLPFPRS